MKIDDYLNSNLILLVPLVGVLIGWLLTNLSGIFKGISDKKKILARSLVELHFLYIEQHKMLNLFELLKDVNGINKNYESMRQMFVERYAYSEENFKETTRVIQELSTVYPLTAIQLKSLIESHVFSQKIKLTENSKDDLNKYVKYLSLYEAGLTLEHDLLRKIILKISFGHGLITWIRIRWKYYQLKKAVDKKLVKKYCLDEDMKEAIKSDNENVEKDIKKQ